MKSTDGGNTWTNLASSVAGISNLAVSRIVIDPTNDQIITITTGRGGYGGPNAGTGNVWRSIDAGANWTSAGLTAGNYCALDISPEDNTYYALAAGAPGKIFKSVDHGQDWTAAVAPDNSIEQDWSIATSKTTAGTIFVVATGSRNVYKSTDSGSTWSNITSGLPGVVNQENNWSQATYDYYISTALEPSATSGEMLFCGLITSCYSVDDGAHWVDYGNTYQSQGGTAIMHNDQHQFASAPSDQSQLLIGCDGGVFNLSITAWNSGSPTISFHPLNANLGITQLYQIAPHPTDDQQILGGAQDNASPSALTAAGGLSSWTNLYAGDGGWCGWNLATNQVLTTSDQGSVYLSDFSGNVQSFIQSASENFDFISPTVFSSDNTKIYLGGTTLQSYLLSSGTRAFTSGNTTLTAGVITYITTVAGDASRIYTGGSDGLLAMTADGGSTYKQLNGAEPSAVVGAIAVNQNNENDILAGFQQTGIDHLWQCQDVTAASPVWTDVSGSGPTALPDVPVSGIVRGPFDPVNNWYVGTDLGVYVTTNAGASWALVTGLPEVQVYDLKYANGYLYAGTYGRGVWIVPIVGLEQIRLQPTTMQGGQQGAVAFYLNTIARSGSVTVNVGSSSSDAVLGSSTITIPQGSQAGNTLIHTLPVDAAEQIKITGSYNGTTLYRYLTLEPATLSGIKVAPTTLEGGYSGALAVYLNGLAGPSGATVSLSSGSPDVTVQGSVMVNPGSNSANVTISTVAVSSPETVTLMATYGATTLNTTVTLNPPLLTGAVLQNATVTGGNPTAIALYLNERAPTGGTTITLSSSSADATIAGTAVIAQGAASTNVVIHTAVVSATEPITITATYGSTTLNRTLTLNPAALTSVKLNPTSVTGGSKTVFSVYLNGPAGPGGTAVSLSSASGDATIIPSVTIPQGATFANVSVSTKAVGASEQVNISATVGATTVTAPLTINP
jgi:photosystem II stability/assembly factor-like uncharacterized protein